jgi:dihydrofolate reductase
MAACLADSRGIGSDQDLPWSIPQDWEYFQRVTTKAYNNNGIEWTEEGCIKWKNVVIMGRLSWESKPMKGKALPNRFCVVLSRNKDYKM